MGVWGIYIDPHPGTYRMGVGNVRLTDGRAHGPSKRARRSCAFDVEGIFVRGEAKILKLIKVPIR